MADPPGPWQRLAARAPGVAGLARVFARLAAWRVRGVPAGLLALLPLAILIDIFDIGDELVGGPIGVGISFILEAAFLMALTGRPSYAAAWAGFDLIPIIDVLPIATITLAREIGRAWRVPREKPPSGQPTVIDV